MKSSLHRLIPFLVLILRLPIPKTRLNSIPQLPSSYHGRLASRHSTLHFSDYSTSVLSIRSRLVCPFITPRMEHTEKTASTVKGVCLLVRYLAMDVLLLHAYASRECVYRVVA
jgi:hypothetical protein